MGVHLMLSKKGQISLFIILGLLILVVLFVLFFRNKEFSSFLLGKNPVDAIKSCTIEALDEGKKIVSSQGGLLEPELFYLYENKKLHYVCYTEESFQGCVMQQPLLKNTVEEELKKYIEPRVETCLRDAQLAVERQGNSMSYKKPVISVIVEPGTLSSEIALDLVITKRDGSESYKTIKTNQNSRLYEMIMVASEIANSEAEYGDSNTDAFMYKDKQLKVEKIKQGDDTKVYILTDRKEGEQFLFAIKSIPITPGWIPE